MSQQGCGKLIVSPSLAQAASTSAGCHFVMCQKVVLNEEDGIKFPVRGNLHDAVKVSQQRPGEMRGPA
jgi:hypothetical protein